MQNPKYPHDLRRTALAGLSLLAWLWCSASPLPSDAPAPPVPELENPLLAEDWARIDRLLLAADPSAVHRLLRGHALLAVNQNDAATCLFANAASLEDLGAWNVWTLELIRRHPGQPVALYLRGDALARHREFQAAIDSFSQALQTAPDHPLLLNARGVAAACRADFAMALVDFERAKRAQPDFADAFANSGALSMLMTEGPRAALDDFRQALARSSSFHLARYGELCMAALLLEENPTWEVSPFAGHCLDDRLTHNYLSGRLFGLDNLFALAQNHTTDAGFSLQERLHPTFSAVNRGQATFGQVVEAYKVAHGSGNQHAIRDVRVATQKFLDQNPGARGAFNRQITQFERDVGLAASLTSRSVSDGASIKSLFLGASRTETLTFDLSHNREAATRTLQALGASRNQFNPGPNANPGGLRSDLSEANFDLGQWPFPAEFGLRYQPEPSHVVNPQNTPQP